MTSIKYLNKEAFDLPGLSLAGTSRAVSGLGSLLPYLVTVPLLLGTGTGYLASRMTSPSGTDAETLQRETVLTKLKSQSGLRERALLAQQRLKELDDDLKTRNAGKTDRFLRV